MMAGAPNRPLPPTPDEDANERTLIMKRVSDPQFVLISFAMPSRQVNRGVAGFDAASFFYKQLIFFYFCKISFSGGMPFSCLLFEFFSRLNW